MSPNNLVCTKDPRGITVRLEEKQWYEHIMAETGHPEMKENVDAIKKTIEDPEFIAEDKDSDPPMDYREMYIGVNVGASYEPRFCTKVITSTGGGYAEVVTAYPVKMNSRRNGMEGDALYESKPKV